jgi:hypothetical protein
MHASSIRTALLSLGCSAVSIIAGVQQASADAVQGARGLDARNARIIEHWTPARRAAAIPRDFVLDEHGQAYLKRRDGSLEPYGRVVASERGGMEPNAKPGTGDTTMPAITILSPTDGATIGTSHTFQARVTDASGLRSVSFRVQKSGSAAQSFSASFTTDNIWAVSLSGFTAGSWSWSVIAKDKANNTATSAVTDFTVSTGGGGGGGDTVANAEWTFEGEVQTAVGRIYFEMPSNARRTRWAGYVCSGTVVEDATTGRSVVLTAAHCVYDDANKAFARNVLFIPDQDGTSGVGTDLNCSNDPFGCWAPAFGVVDINWTTRTFPDNVAWDYAYYVVNDAGAHSGTGGANPALDASVASLPINFLPPSVDNEVVGATSSDFTYALGYSYSDDPHFMYCAEDMTTEGAVNWWLPSCELSGGSSGGAWVQPMQTDQAGNPVGTGDIISVNSWGYTTSPGMAGPKLSGSSASCVFSQAKSDAPALPAADGDEGLKATCP